jgi:hypothetical protein
MTDDAPASAAACARCGAVNPSEASICGACGAQLRGDDAELGARETVPVSESSAVSFEQARPSAGNAWDDVRDSVAPAGPDPLIGLVIAGRYRIVECIGRGGMGVVYRVEHTEIGKLLALKLLAGGLARQREVVRRFKREALLASRLSHPNSVQVFDYGVFEGLTYLVMELVSGRDLARIIKSEGALSFDRVGRIVVQVCSSLAEAHGIGIVHRDLKPENILIARAPDGSDFAKVLDFGLAKLREAPELNEVTGSGQVVGTPYYMAPEQIHGRPVDGRTDIYALGAVMYEAITGTTVFQGTSPMAVLTRHLTERPVPIRERAPHRLIAPAVEDIVMRALEKDPAHRFQTVQELQEALVEQLGGAGQFSVNALLSPAQMHALQADIARAARQVADDDRDDLARTLVRGGIATRDEVAAFHRKLARQRRMTWAAVALVACGVVYAGVRAYARATRPPGFTGAELEPNNRASEATPVPFGLPVRGKLGKRIDPQRGDRDFYQVIVPAGVDTVKIELAALPNISTCLMVYKSGETDSRTRLCIGQPGRDLIVPAYRVEPGSWLFAVMQDMDGYEGAKPFVLENVSDDYRLLVARAEAPADEQEEIEPNDAEAGATIVPPGGAVSGIFGWSGDLDYVCVGPPNGGRPATLRWVVDDAVDRTRDRGAVLEVVPSTGSRAGVAMRLHRRGAAGGVPSPDDVVAPWASDAFPLDASAGRACLRLRLTTDPWAGADAPRTPPVGNERWSVRAELVATSERP